MFLRRLYGWITLALNAAGTLLILALSLLINADVVGRGAFAHPINGVNEFAALALVAVVFLQIGAATAAGKLTRSDVVPLMLQRRSRRVAAALEAVYDLCGFALFVIMANAAWSPFLRAFNDGEYVGVAGIATFPTWPVRGLILVSSVLMAIYFAASAFAAARAVASPPAKGIVKPQEMTQ